MTAATENSPSPRGPRIVKAGHPALQVPATPVADPTAPEIAALVADMQAALKEAGGVGLAAPQIGVSLRVVIFFVPPHRLTGAPDDVAQDMTILINPEIEPLDAADIEADWEACLSMPGLRGKVPRWRRIRYSGYDLSGQRIDRQVSGFHARVVQHECDHLDGRLYPTRMGDLSSLVFTDEWMAAHGE